MPQAPIITTEEYNRLMSSNSDGENGLRDITMLTISFKMGLRAGEIAALTLKQVLNQDGTFRQTMYVKPQKTPRGRELPFHPEVKEVLANYIDSFIWKSLEEPLFISRSGYQFNKATINAFFKRCFLKANLPHFSSHSGRRSCATNLNRKGVNIRTIQKILGHTSINTTAIYCESNLDDMTNAITQL